MINYILNQNINFFYFKILLCQLVTKKMHTEVKWGKIFDK